MGAWDALAGVVLALLGSYVFVAARSFPRMAGQYPGPGLFPQLLGALLVIAGVALVVGSVAGGRARVRRALLGGSRRERLSALLVVAAVIFYIVAVTRLGFAVVSVLILSGLMAALGVRVRWSVLIGVGTTVVLYVLFARLLRVPLPEGILRGLL
ncbi:MAG: tripartite tricarboxylate transporter TctB family protein [Armatimonadota bacterium]|nr:tripartite tricarboxylate transporter TctB family protein [Armatimonadota bacterium]MDR7403454.1 tripartite tricarboxylate transporter TctB family protein [Armatimonadota bacterium]